MTPWTPGQSPAVASPSQAPRRLVGHWGYLRWSIGAQLTRLPIAMAPLAFTALTTGLTGSYATGAAVVAIVVIAEVVSAVPIGRLLDRWGATALRVLLVARAVAYALILASVVAGLPTPVILVLAALVGVLGGGLLGGFRALLFDVVGEALLRRAVTVNTMVVDLVIVAGPLLVGVLSGISIILPVVAMAAASAVAALFVAASRRTTGGSVVGAPCAALFRPLLGWVCVAFAIGHLTSTIEVAALPIAQRLGGGTGEAALFVLVLSAASIIGSIVYLAARRDGSALGVAILLVVLSAGALLISIGQSWPLVIVGAVVAGLCVGPLVTVNSLLVEVRLPPNRKAEGFALVNTAQGLGFGAGALSLAVLPLSVVQLLGLASPLLAAAVVVARRKTITADQPDVARTHPADADAAPDRSPERRDG